MWTLNHNSNGSGLPHHHDITVSQTFFGGHLEMEGGGVRGKTWYPSYYSHAMSLHILSLLRLLYHSVELHLKIMVHVMNVAAIISESFACVTCLQFAINK